MMNRWITLLVVLAAGSGGAVRAQDRKPDDAFARALFAPELVLKYAGEIGLKPAQRQTIMDAIKKVQIELVPIQLDMAEPAQDLLTLIDQPQVDEAQALAKVDKVLSVEREVKRRQLTLLIRIKNALTKEQQDKLKTLRRRDAAESSGSPDHDNDGVDHAMD
jgi:Spy/CpxP family protein refolding chaperone